MITNKTKMIQTNTKSISLGRSGVANAHNLTSHDLATLLTNLTTREYPTQDIYRNLPTKDHQDNYKKTLPFFIPTGRFNSNNVEGIDPTTYTNIVCLDIDLIDKENVSKDINQQIESLYNTLTQDLTNKSLYISQSISGKGIYILFHCRIEGANVERELTLDQIKQRHELYYTYTSHITNEILTKHNYSNTFKIDHLPNLNRARIISSNLGGYINLDSTITIPRTYIESYLTKKEEEQKNKRTSRSTSANVDKITQHYQLSKHWATNTHGEFVYGKKGNQNSFIHHLASALNNLGIDKETAITLIYQDLLSKDNDTLDKVPRGYLDPIDTAYKRTDQFGTYQLHSNKDVKERLLTLIEKKYSYLAKIDQKKSLPLLDEIEILREVYEMV